jgi:hypothetical protein
MKKKYVAVGIVLLFVGVSLIPAIVQSRDSPSLPTTRSALKTDKGLSILPGRGLALDSVIQLSWNASETEEPLEPGGAPRSINITVTYRTLVSTFIGDFILFYCRLTQRYITVSLEIGEIPSWCNASLSTPELSYLITRNESSQLITLTVAVDEHAPADVSCRVPIDASVDALHGPFGFLPFVNEYNLTSILYFRPGYFAHIVVIPENDSMAVIPNESSYLRIFITNAGNARTVVSGSIVRTPPGDWITMMTDQIVLDENMTSVAYLFVVPPVNFNGTDTIILSFTPYKADDQSQHGEPVYVLIHIIYKP